MSYSAGNLELSILGFSENAVASIDVTAKALRRLASSIDKINNTQFVLAGQKMEVLFTKISQATSSIDTKNISNLATAARSLSSISKIGNLEKVDFTKVGNGFSTLTVAITPFINKVKEAETSLNALYGILNKSSGNKIGNLLNTGTTSGGTSKKSFGGFFKNFLKLGRWTAVLYAGKRIGNEMANIVNAGSDFGETLNLWKVAMGNEFLPQATEFVNKLNEAYGISKETLMNSQAIFKNMLGSLGQISSETAYRLSEGITQMALDYASLYNVKFEDAMTKFQAALAGQVRPIRSVSGYDITENTLFQLYQTLGGEKTMRQLSRTEKQLLAIYAVFEQMGRSGATGDLERTINSFANQSRVFADSWKEVQTYAGLTVTRLLEQYNIMKYVNAVLIFMSRILEGLATSLDTGLGNSGEVFGDMENGVNATTEAVENLKSSLLDFDKFRALDQTSGDNILGIDETILDAMTKYDGILEGASLEARNLADAWLQALGYVDANNDGIIDMQNGIDDIAKKINEIDWGVAGENLSNTLTDALYSTGETIRNLPWSDWGTDVANFISQANWGDLIIGAINFIDDLAGAVSDFIVAILTETDWVGVFKKIIIAPLEYVLLELGIIDMAKDMFRFAEGTKFWEWMFGDYAYKSYATGGLPDKGTMFVAGEAGAEMVYNMPNGQSGVANVRQIEQAMYNALARYGEQNGGEIVVQAYLDGEKVYENTTARAKSQGFVWAKA